jgi:uncharacterized protein (TIGR00725 family)
MPITPSAPKIIRKKLPAPYHIAIIGSMEHATPTVLAAAYAIGAEIAKSGHVTITAAEAGISYEAAYGSRAQRGVSVGFSRAESAKEHTGSLELPLEAWDVVVYCGLDYANRHSQMFKSIDAIILVLHDQMTVTELVEQMDEGIVVGVLTSSDGITDVLAKSLSLSYVSMESVVYDSSPKKLVSRIIKEVKRSSL